MTVSILTPEKLLFTGEASRVKVPGTSGQFEILKDHAAIVSSLSKGDLILTMEDGEKKTFEISRGFIEVINNDISILVQK